MPHIFLIYIILFFTFSCTSDNIENDIQTAYKLVKVNSNDVLGNLISISEYIYNEDKNLDRIIIQGSSIQIIHNYLGDNIISIIASSDSEERITEFIYNGDLVISSSTEVLVNNQPALFSTSYEYNAAKELIGEIFFVDNIMACERTFVNNNQNVSSVSVSCEGLYTYEYDTMKNPYYLLYNTGLSKILQEGLNNKIKEEFSESNSIKTYTYEYNSQNYPIRSNYYIDNELQFTKTYIYESL